MTRRKGIVATKHTLRAISARPAQPVCSGNTQVYFFADFSSLDLYTFLFQAGFVRHHN